MFENSVLGAEGDRHFLGGAWSPAAREVFLFQSDLQKNVPILCHTDLSPPPSPPAFGVHFCISWRARELALSVICLTEQKGQSHEIFLNPQRLSLIILIWSPRYVWFDGGAYEEHRWARQRTRKSGQRGIQVNVIEDCRGDHNQWRPGWQGNVCSVVQDYADKAEECSEEVSRVSVHSG